MFDWNVRSECSIGMFDWNVRLDCSIELFDGLYFKKKNLFGEGRHLGLQNEDSAVHAALLHLDDRAVNHNYFGPLTLDHNYFGP